ncbi:PCRF domain-containing protein [Aeromonas hydrophila]|uniref:PCRF domain-containing protein n=1 Tax=Aeromonas hydrophila TaxID=644 RepID=A0A926FK58_AERHY|nr:PCRF domain-containing protein [Aeromonas hydrophila]
MLGEADVAADQDRYRALTREYAQLEDIVHAFQQFRQAEENLDATRQMLEG